MDFHFNDRQYEDPQIDFHRFVLLFTHSFSDRVRFVSELELEHAFVEGLEEAGELEEGEEDLQIGEASIDPCAAPLGAEHNIIVRVFEQYEDLVDKATVRLESPGRGADEYKLKPDSADQGLYKTSLVSVGVGEERRSDFVRFKLWEVDPDGDEEDN